MFGNGIQYVVRFDNGKYYAGPLWSCQETDDLNWVMRYGMEWQVAKDLSLQMYCKRNNKTYKIIKVKVEYIILEDEN